MNTLKATTLVNQSQPVDFSDVTYAYGFLWGVNDSSQTIVRVNTATGLVSSFDGSAVLPAALNTALGLYGAAWTYGNGDLGFDRNDGTVLQIAVANPGGTPTFSLVSKQVGPSQQKNDGTNCAALAADLAIVKTGPATVAAGGSVSWNLTVTNNGPGASSGFVVNDTVPAGYTAVATTTTGCTVTANAVQCVGGALALNASTTITITATAPIPLAACITNVATVFGNEADPNSANNSSSFQTCAVTTLKLTKALSGARLADTDQFAMQIHTGSAAGPVVNSTTNSTTAGIGATVTAGSGTTGAFAATPSTTYYLTEAATGTTNLAGYANATITCTDANNLQTGLPTAAAFSGSLAITPVAGAAISCTLTNTPNAPAITVVKSASVPTVNAVGNVVTYTFTVKNTGNVALSAISITDTQTLPSLASSLGPITCAATTLAAGISTTCTAVYTVTQADLDNGTINDSAVANGTPPTGSPIVSPPSPATVTAAPAPSLTILKTATPSTVSAVGNGVTYSFLVTNTGNVTLTNVSVTDTQILPSLASSLGPITCLATTLAPTTSTTCSATYTVTQADITNATINDSAVAHGTPPVGAPITSTPSTATVTVVAASPFSCVTPTVFDATGGPTKLEAQFQNAGGSTFTQVGTNSVWAYNAIGFNQANNLIYGVSNNGSALTGHLLQIDANGNIVDLGAITGPSTADLTHINVGFFDAAGNFWIAASTSEGASGLLYKVNLTTGVATALAGQVGKVNAPDLTFLSGYAWGVGVTGLIQRVDLTGGAITAFAAPAGMPVSQYGAAWTYLNGNLGFDINSGGIYQVAIANPAGTPTFTLVSTAGGPSSVNNDGTSCGGPADLTVTKSASTAVTADGSQIVAGGTVTWTLTITNNGPGNSSGFVLNDAVSAAYTNVAATAASANIPGATSANGFGCTVTGNNVQCVDGFGAAGLAPGATATITMTATAPATGCPTNIANVLGNEQDNGVQTSNTSTTCVSSYTLAKTASVTPSPAGPGSVITYTVTVTNTGSGAYTAANPATFSDDLSKVLSGAAFGSVTTTPAGWTVAAPGGASPTTLAGTGPLAVGASVSVQYTVTVDSPVVVNKLVNVVTTTNPTGSCATAGGCTTTTLLPDLVVAKSSSPASTTVLRPGQPITYTLTFDNTSGAAPAPVAWTDNAAAVLDDATVTTAPHLASGAGLTVSAISGGAFTINGSLAAGTTATVTYTVQVNVPDIGDHNLDNYLLPTGNTPPVTCLATNPDCTTNPVAQLSIVKSSTTTAITSVGQVVPYLFTVKNTGNVTLTNVTVTDTQVAPSLNGGLSAITCLATTLAAGASTTCSASYTVTQADYDNPTVQDSATVIGTPPSGPPTPPTPPSTVIIPVTPAPAITVLKSASVSTVNAVGNVVTYSFLVTNTGNVPLTNVTVTDTQTLPSLAASLGPITCPVTALAAGTATTCTATYTVTQADLNNGTINDSATATGTPPTGPPPVSPPSTATVTAIPAPALTIVKSSTTTAITSVGQVVPYLFTVKNTGNVTLTNVTVTDTQVAPSLNGGLSAITCLATTLAPTATMTCSANYTVTLADYNNPTVADSATVVGTPPSGPPTPPSPPSDVIIPVTSTPALTIVKSSTTTAITTVGQVVPYSFLVTNTGNVTLTSVTVTDTQVLPSLNGSLSAITCVTTTLAAGASTTCAANYTVTQADLDHGTVEDSATVIGTPPSGPPTPPTPPSDVIIPVTSTPALTIVKSSTTTAITAVGQLVPYSFLVTNTGNVTLTNVTVTDTQVAPSLNSSLSAITCLTTMLAPTASTTCAANYTVTQADYDNPTVQDSATVIGTPPSGPPTPPTPPSTVIIPVTPAPALTIVKSATPATVGAAGAVVTYSFVVANTGNVALSNMTVNETSFSGTGPLGAITCGPTNIANGAVSLAIAASITCTATYAATQADIDAGIVTNTATATGTPPVGPPVTSPPSNATVTAAAGPAISVTKSSTTSAITAVGQVIPYSFLVTNNGNVTLTNIVVTDTQVAPSLNGGLTAINCPATTLAPTVSTTCTANYTVTLADYNNPTVADSATVVGTPPSGPPTPPSPPSDVIIPVTPAPSLTIVKSSTTTAITSVGQVVPYLFTVKNTGNVTLTSVTVTDTQVSPSLNGSLSAITCVTTTLAAGALTTCAANYTVTQADLDHGTVEDSATVIGTPPSGPPTPPTPPSDVIIPVTSAPSLTIVKSSSTTAITTVGQVVPYAFLVTNTGNVTLTNVTVTDVQTAPAIAANLGPITCGPTKVANGALTLAPAASASCTAAYTVTKADFGGSSLTDTATAIGTPPNGPPTSPTPPSKVTIPVLPLVSGGGLAFTGAPVEKVLSAAMGLLVVGLALLLFAGRRKRDEDEV